MDENYTELKGVPELHGSINMYVSSAHRMKRPPSLSESFAWTPENVERALATSKSNTSLNLLDIQDAAAPTPPSSPTIIPVLPTVSPITSNIVHVLLKFLFHITLISIFESVFFFLYVSSLEDNGINITVGEFITDAIHVCSNFTAGERVITNDFLSLFINASTVINSGNVAYANRTSINTVLFNRSWIYVGSLSGLFILVACFSFYKKIKIPWKYLILENFGLVLMLAAYEYMFFSTVIFPYNPISGPEIARNAIYDFQGSCGLFVYNQTLV